MATRSNSVTVSLLTFGLATALSSAAMAQAQKGDCVPGGRPDLVTEYHSTPEHQKKLHDALKLTPQQEGAWQKYLESLRPAAPSGQSGKRADWATLNAPERTQLVADAAKRDQDYMTQVVNGMKTFYGTLTPEQKKTFDIFYGGEVKKGG